MPAWMIWSFVESARGGICGYVSSILERAMESSRRMETHSWDLRLECWKRRRTGVERSREVYWRWRCDLRNTGGL